MESEGYLRGHKIICIDEYCFYADIKEPTASTYKDRPCGNCGKQYTKEGHDACLGTLKGLMNACCGHGENRDAYVQFLDKTSIHDEDAVVILNVLKRNK